jgi:hypothetical protein
MEPERVSANDVREKVENNVSMLVCAYDDDDKFKGVHLDGAISLNDFKSKTDTMGKDQEVFFYCA